MPVLGDLISTGLLINALGTIVDTDVGYDLVATPRALERSEVRRFAGWITEEAETDRASRAGISNLGA